GPGAAPVQRAAQKGLRCRAVAACLDQDVEYHASLVDGTPQPMLPSVDLELHLVQVPLVPWSGAPPTQRRGKHGPELAAPQPDGLVGERHAPLRQQLLHVSQAQPEPVVQPDAVADDLRRETVALVRDSRYRQGDDTHRAILPTSPLTLTIPALSPHQ